MSIEEKHLFIIDFYHIWCYIWKDNPFSSKQLKIIAMLLESLPIWFLQHLMLNNPELYFWIADQE